jgi:hypothetical protein
MEQPQIHSEAQSAVRNPAGDCVYQFAIILAALLMIVTAALF